MIVTLTSGETIFEIANGEDRVARVVSRAGFTLQQSTQTALRVRAGWLAAFHSRASRSISRGFTVAFPECESVAAAEEQALAIPVLCPRGGVLEEQHGGTLVTYEDAWIEGSIQVEPLGVRNFFTFNFTAINPAISTPPPLALMDTRFKVNLNAPQFNVTGLTGGTTGKLDALATAGVALGCKGEVFLQLGSLWQTKTFQLVTLATAASVTGGVGSENADPAAGTLIVHPDDRDAETNDKIWLEVL